MAGVCDETYRENGLPSLFLLHKIQQKLTHRWIYLVLQNQEKRPEILQVLARSC